MGEGKLSFLPTKPSTICWSLQDINKLKPDTSRVTDGVLEGYTSLVSVLLKVCYWAGRGVVKGSYGGVKVCRNVARGVKRVLKGVTGELNVCYWGVKEC